MTRGVWTDTGGTGVSTSKCDTMHINFNDYTFNTYNDCLNKHMDTYSNLGQAFYFLVTSLPVRENIVYSNI